MPLPKKLKIGAVTYTIAVVEGLKDEDGELRGCHDGDNGIISLCTDLPKDVELTTLFHEIMHALVDSYSLGLRDEERVVDCISNGLVALFRDNPRLINYVKEAIR